MNLDAHHNDVQIHMFGYLGEEFYSIVYPHMSRKLMKLIYMPLVYGKNLVQLLIFSKRWSMLYQELMLTGSLLAYTNTGRSGILESTTS
jgi:hypothetical protein